MALGDSIVSVCNIALDALGENPVVSVFPPDNTKRAIACSRRYDDCRRFILRSHPWNGAKKQGRLAALAAPPQFGYANAFQLPADFMRLSDEGLPRNRRDVWRIYGQALYTDIGAPLDFPYIYDLQDPSIMDPGLVHTVAAMLASEIGMSVTMSSAKVQNALKVLEGKGAMSRLVGSQDGSPVEWDVDIWLESRN